MFRYNSLSGFVYKAPELCNYFCHSDCEEGQLYVPEVLEIQQTLEQLSIMIEESIAGGIAYRIFNDGAVAGGMVLRIEGSHGELELLFVDPKVHSKGIGYAVWCAVEEMYPEVEIWETRTPDSTNICGETNLQLNVFNIFAFRIVGTPIKLGTAIFTVTGSSQYKFTAAPRACFDTVEFGFYIVDMDLLSSLVLSG